MNIKELEKEVELAELRLKLAKERLEKSRRKVVIGDIFMDEKTNIHWMIIEGNCVVIKGSPLGKSFNCGEDDTIWDCYTYVGNIKDLI